MASPITVQAPDGKVIQFPQGMDEKAVSAQMTKMYPGGKVPETFSQGFKAETLDPIMSAVRHPIDTATSIAKEAVGGGYYNSTDEMMQHLQKTNPIGPMADQFKAGNVKGGLGHLGGLVTMLFGPEAVAGLSKAAGTARMVSRANKIQPGLEAAAETVGKLPDKAMGPITDDAAASMKKDFPSERFRVQEKGPRINPADEYFRNKVQASKMQSDLERTKAGGPKDVNIKPLVDTANKAIADSKLSNDAGLTNQLTGLRDRFQKVAGTDKPRKWTMSVDEASEIRNNLSRYVKKVPEEYRADVQKVADSIEGELDKVLEKEGYSSPKAAQEKLGKLRELRSDGASKGSALKWTKRGLGGGIGAYAGHHLAGWPGAYIGSHLGAAGMDMIPNAAITKAGALAKTVGRRGPQVLTASGQSNASSGDRK